MGWHGHDLLGQDLGCGAWPDLLVCEIDELCVEKNELDAGIICDGRSAAALTVWGCTVEAIHFRVHGLDLPKQVEHAGDDLGKKTGEFGG